MKANKKQIVLTIHFIISLLMFIYHNHLLSLMIIISDLKIHFFYFDLIDLQSLYMYMYMLILIDI